MPFNFIEIEEQKNKSILFLFIFLIIHYFIFAYFILLILRNILGYFFFRDFVSFCLPSFKMTSITFIIAFIIAAVHWQNSVSDLIGKISVSLGAVLADPDDSYHNVFSNIVSEVSVAIGNRPIQAMVIPDADLNAYALEDFSGQAVIGVTEGLLARFNRAQIEAVVAHEAGHIISGDCLSSTVTCAIAEIYEEILSRIKETQRFSNDRELNLLFYKRRDPRPLLYLMLLPIVSLSKLVRLFISREREYRADAISVRLTRNPLSLAEALKLISRGWRGEGAFGDRMQSIFIVNPRMERLDEEEGFFAEMFSTHPPINKRIDILLSMAHLGPDTLEENIKNFKHVSLIAETEFIREDPSSLKKWSVFKDQNWLGPFYLQELETLKDFRPTDWVKLEGDNKIKIAYEEEPLLKLFKKINSNLQGEAVLKSACPNCKVELNEIIYEGALLLKCFFCGGVFVEEDKISRILIRNDAVFSAEIEKQAQLAMKSRFQLGLKRSSLFNSWMINCPGCARKMRRDFFVLSYPVEVDTCFYCGGIWFDKNELEVIQYIYEHGGNILPDLKRN